MKRFLQLFLLILIPQTLVAQKTTRVDAEYSYFAPSNISPEKAKQIALQRAKIEAIAKEFGTLVSQSNFTDIESNNETTTTNFQSIGGSEVKGEWIEDLSEPVYDISYKDDQLIVNVKIRGVIRELSYAVTRFEAKVLRNGTESKYQSDSFNDSDDIFLSFKSPTNGFLSVYLTDGKSAYCLLPYKNSKDTDTKIEHSTDYVFFSEKESLDHSEIVDEYTLTATESTEYNQIYIIFSPNPFSKANDADVGAGLPRELPIIEFQKWLSNNRNQDTKMQVEVENITIKR